MIETSISHSTDFLIVVGDNSKRRVVQLEGTIEDHRILLPDHFRVNQTLKNVSERATEVPSGH